MHLAAVLGVLPALALSAPALASPTSLERCASLGISRSALVARAQAALGEAQAALADAEEGGPAPQILAEALWAPPALGTVQGDWLAPGTARAVVGVDFPIPLGREGQRLLRAAGHQAISGAQGALAAAQSDAAAAGILSCLTLFHARAALEIHERLVAIGAAATQAAQLRRQAAVLLPADAAAVEAQHASALAERAAAAAQLAAEERLAREVLGIDPVELAPLTDLEAPPPLAGYAERAAAWSGAMDFRGGLATAALRASAEDDQIDLILRAGVDSPRFQDVAFFGLVGARYATTWGEAGRRERRRSRAEAQGVSAEAEAQSAARERQAAALRAAAALESASAAIPARAQEAEMAREKLRLVQAVAVLGAPGKKDEETPHALHAGEAAAVRAQAELGEARHRALLAAVELWRLAGAGEELARALCAGDACGSADPSPAPAAAGTPAARFAALSPKGLWVWDSPALLRDPARASALWSRCRRWGFGTVYLFVGEPGDPAAPIARTAALAALVRGARAAGLSVEALAGDPEWLQPGGEERASALNLALASWQRTHVPEESFSALHLDIEPHSLPAWRDTSESVSQSPDRAWRPKCEPREEQARGRTSWYGKGLRRSPAKQIGCQATGAGLAHRLSGRAALLAATLRLLESARAAVQPLPLAADVPDTLEEQAAAKVAALVDRLVIMAYRVRPGAAAERAAPLCALAERAGRPAVVALDTAAGGEPGTTFHGDRDALFAAAVDLAARLGGACGALAIHDERGLAETLGSE